MVMRQSWPDIINKNRVLRRENYFNESYMKQSELYEAAVKVILAVRIAT